MLREDSGLQDVTLVDAVVKMVEKVGKMRRPADDNELAGSREDLASVVRGIDSDLLLTYAQVSAKVRALERLQVGPPRLHRSHSVCPPQFWTIGATVWLLLVGS